MIKILRIDGRSAPVLVCDVCAARIEDIRAAAAVNDFDRASLAEGDVAGVLHVHKGACHNRADAAMEARGLPAPGWVELHQHLTHLVHNVGSSPEALTEYDAMLERTGLDSL